MAPARRTPNLFSVTDQNFHMPIDITTSRGIAAWREQKYHEREEHEAFRVLLGAPTDDAQIILDSRFPVPRYITCDQHKSEARFVMARLNPSVTHNSTDSFGGQVIATDDVSLKVFMEHLAKLAVQS